MAGSPAPHQARPLARTRSFTRRGSRMPAGHQRAYDAMAGDFVLPVPRAADGDDTTVDPAFRLDAPVVFGRRAPLVLEIGPGSGDALRAGAEARPDWDFLGLEVWRPGIGQSLARMRAAPLPNLRLAEVDAALALASMVEPGSVREVWTYFPDPWPKRRHHPRRLVSACFADRVAAAIEPGGVWRLATDWAPYGRAMRSLLDADERFTLTSTDRAPLRPVTRFERKGLEVDREITNLNYARR
ncbi:MAG TPA: tRNA (guanosine(46)-N7)-methyltransferase TrmB [Ornithinimicrobium sp.]|uniref:tRNA (guanosine(46)-N7)-methyltransferase TrmB n=1 Tax=Ornithinimicrobium sp. TaxID=1977084 RepID=UPI002B461EF7|nr:tRNA (guanosine(46)-N7)-methyltransferase TrmB [Ornithinimicrobium sp.]HKJ10921.1 tRNA (guanosine(46)-N7)-methyltransferase TrmB [Ornithinimicrobium sp.]